MTTATYLGCDVETTGLDPHATDRPADILLEVGLIAFDARLNPLKSISYLVNSRAVAQYREAGLINSYVEEMHTTNGLWAELEAANHEDTTSETVEANLAAWIDDNGYRGLPMLGSSITFDRGFLAAEMPEVARRFHYRSVDATTVAILADVSLGLDPREALSDEHETTSHRVLADIANSAALIRTCLGLIADTPNSPFSRG